MCKSSTSTGTVQIHTCNYLPALYTPASTDYLQITFHAGPVLILPLYFGTPYNFSAIGGVMRSEHLYPIAAASVSRGLPADLVRPTWSGCGGGGWCRWDPGGFSDLICGI